MRSAAVKHIASAALSGQVKGIITVREIMPYKLTAQ